jgi:hypothetical protein
MTLRLAYTNLKIIMTLNHEKPAQYTDVKG